MKKKAQLQELGGLATGIAALGIVLVVAFLIMSKGNEQVSSLISLTTHDNETKSIPNATTTCFADCVDNEAMSVTAITNCSGIGCYGVNIGSANYSVSKNCVVMAYQTGTPGVEANKNITYSCKRPDSAYNATRDLQNATDDVPGWIPLVVITVCGAVLIGLVAMFRNR